MNPNIALSVRRPKFNALADRAAAGQIHSQQMQASNNALQMKRARQGMKREDALRNSLMNAQTPEQIADAYRSVGDAPGLMKAQEHAQTTAKRKLEMSAAELEIARGQAAGLQEAAGLARTPEGFGAAKALMEKIKPGSSAPLGDQWSPETAQAMQELSMTAAEALAAQQGAAGKTEPYPPEVAAQKTQIAAAGKSTTNVNTYQEKEEDKAYGKSLVGQYDKIIEQAEGAQSELNNLYMLDKMQIDTGAAEPAKAFLGKWALALGFSQEQLDNIGIQNVGTTESFEGVAQNLVLTKMQLQKGPQTEYDAQRIAKTVATLGNTPEAKDFLIKASIALREREIEQARFYDNWKADKGTFDGARNAWNHWKETTPLMGTNPSSDVPVFYQEFMTRTAEANPDASPDAIRKLWRKKYGR